MRATFFTFQHDFCDYLLVLILFSLKTTCTQPVPVLRGISEIVGARRRLCTTTYYTCCCGVPIIVVKKSCHRVIPVVSGNTKWEDDDLGKRYRAYFTGTFKSTLFMLPGFRKEFPHGLQKWARSIADLGVMVICQVIRVSSPSIELLLDNKMVKPYLSSLITYLIENLITGRTACQHLGQSFINPYSFLQTLNISQGIEFPKHVDHQVWFQKAYV